MSERENKDSKAYIVVSYIGLAGVIASAILVATGHYGVIPLVGWPSVALIAFARLCLPRAHIQ